MKRSEINLHLKDSITFFNVMQFKLPSWAFWAPCDWKGKSDTCGESICLEQGMSHRFYGEAGKGKVLVGEVNMVNDDSADNCFYEPVGRFPDIIVDEKALHMLASDYAKNL